MSKFTIIALVSVFATICQGYPKPQSDIVRAASDGNWKQVQKLLDNIMSSDKLFGMKQFDLMDSNFFDNFAKTNVKDLKPIKGGKVYGESQVAFQSSTIDATGNQHVTGGGHKIINDNGKVEEYDFKPKL